MASFTYASFWDDLSKGNFNMSADTFKGMLVTSSYTPNKVTHAKRSDISNEVVGAGYSSGGAVTVCTNTKDTGLEEQRFAFAAITWAASTITARGLVIYKSRGGLSSADELVGYVDFLGDITSTANNFVATISDPIIISNPGG